MSDRFVDVRAWEPADDGDYFRSGVGSTEITRALGKDGPRSADGDFGNATHVAVLQPDLLEDRVVVPPATVLPGSGEGQRARYAAWKKENAGKIQLSQKDYDKVRAMRDELERRRTLAWLRESGIRFEQAYQAHDTITGLQIRVRADAQRGSAIFDLKTAKAPDFDSFQRSVHSYLYAVQAALYLDVLKGSAFCWIVVGKEWPHRCGLYKCPEMWIELGRRAYRAGLTILAHTEKRERPRAWWETKAYELDPPPFWAEAEVALHERYADELLDAAIGEREQQDDEQDDEDETANEFAGWEATT